MNSTASNKDIVLSFYEKGLNRKDFDAASQYLGDPYVQHNPLTAEGREGFKAFIGFLKQKYPDMQCEVKRAFADGDYVILHVHATLKPDDRGMAIVDIFRLEAGKIVEHWDVIQPIPEKFASGNGMF